MSNSKGLVGWHTNFASQFGLERWKDSLYPSMKKTVCHVCLPKRVNGPPNDCIAHETLPGVFVAPSNTLSDDYYLDGASVACALSLEACAGDKILDMCSAPGGKAIIIARTMQSGELVCNELSKPRLLRLKKSVSEFADENMLTIRFTNQDACHVGGDLSRLGPFDKILLDAACSSDRHLLESGSLNEWSMQTVRQNAERQLKMLKNAATLLKPGGLIVYSTCALSEKENDGVIAKFLRESLNFQFDKESLQKNVFLMLPAAEETDFGCLLLPDRPGNYGPLYIAHLRKSKSLVV